MENVEIFSILFGDREIGEIILPNFSKKRRNSQTGSQRRNSVVMVAQLSAFLPKKYFWIILCSCCVGCLPTICIPHNMTVPKFIPQFPRIFTTPWIKLSFFFLTPRALQSFFSQYFWACHNTAKWLRMFTHPHPAKYLSIPLQHHWLLTLHDTDILQWGQC